MTSWKQWLLPMLCSAIPLAAVGFLIARHYVDVPVWDQWELVPLLEKTTAGTLTLRDLWSQHNEHRLFFPRLLMIGLAHLTGWSIGAELALNVSMALGVFAILAFQLGEALRAFDAPRYAVWLLPVMALQVFSLQQYENWLWGWQIAIFANTFASTLGLVLLARPRFRWRHFTVACLCGIVALYSFANGMLYWLVGALLLWLTPPKPVSRAWLAGCLWAITGALAIGLFLVDYHPVSGHPTLTIVWERPLAYVEYVLTYLGAPIISSNGTLATWMGLFNVGLFAALLWSARHWLAARRRVLLPFIGLGLYALGSAAITGLGRAGFGSAQAMESRYVTLAYGLGLANIILLVLSWPMPEGQPPAAPVLAISIAAALVLLIGWSSLWARPRFAERRAYLLPARAALMALSDDSILTRLYPTPAVVRQRTPFLQAERLSVFHYAEP